jgi:hypothetical protein
MSTSTMTRETPLTVIMDTNTQLIRAMGATPLAIMNTAATGDVNSTMRTAVLSTAGIMGIMASGTQRYQHAVLRSMAQPYSTYLNELSLYTARTLDEDDEDPDEFAERDDDSDEDSDSDYNTDSGASPEVDTPEREGDMPHPDEAGHPEQDDEEEYGTIGTEDNRAAKSTSTRKKAGGSNRSSTAKSKRSTPSKSTTRKSGAKTTGATQSKSNSKGPAKKTSKGK